MAEAAASDKNPPLARCGLSSSPMPNKGTKRTLKRCVCEGVCSACGRTTATLSSITSDNSRLLPEASASQQRQKFPLPGCDGSSPESEGGSEGGRERGGLMWRLRGCAPPGQHHLFSQNYLRPCRLPIQRCHLLASAGNREMRPNSLTVLKMFEWK